MQSLLTDSRHKLSPLQSLPSISIMACTIEKNSQLHPNRQLVASSHQLTCIRIVMDCTIINKVVHNSVHKY